MKKVLLIIPILFLCGCESRECIKSHQEETVCAYTIYNGKTVQPVLVPCIRNVCDEYKEE